MRKNLTLVVLAIAILAGLISVFASSASEYHVHADFKVYINGETLNFSQEKYMAESSNDPLIHLHDLNGGVLHVHDRNATLGEFFTSVGMKFNSSCLALDNGSSYCNGGGMALKMFVNGSQNSQFGSYRPKDLDRILITYGSGSAAIQNQINSVTENACVYSGKCPERGSPPPESCSSSGGCPVH